MFPSSRALYPTLLDICQNLWVTKHGSDNVGNVQLCGKIGDGKGVIRWRQVRIVPQSLLVSPKSPRNSSNAMLFSLLSSISSSVVCPSLTYITPTLSSDFMNTWSNLSNSSAVSGNWPSTNGGFRLISLPRDLTTSSRLYRSANTHEAGIKPCTV